MDIIPAIDLKSGKCVRLLQGRDDATTEYSADPVAVAQEWVAQGARRLHVVNLDGAFGRSSKNFEIVKEIVAAVDAKIQFGGGLRSKEAIDHALAAGCDRVVIGTAAVANPVLLQQALSDHGTDRVIVALDASRGKVATHGWQTVSEENVVDCARRVHQFGAGQILYTDISRDGMMNGPDLSTLIALCATGVTIIASGGISSNDDVLSIIALRQPAINGVIIGKALYEKRISLPTLLNQISNAEEKNHPMP